MLKKIAVIHIAATFFMSAATPNIVLIYADDLGYTDLSCQGSRYYETPHIDRLAKEGMIFTQAYAGAANCAPSRACLMTGQYTPRHGIFTVASSVRGQARHRQLIPTENRRVLDPKFETMAEALKKQGYQTCVAGKWHLSPDPTQDGFDTNFGGSLRGHPRSYFAPYGNPKLTDGPEGEHLPERLGREVSGWIRDHAKAPFFVYLPFFSVHTPIQATAELTTKYAGKTPDGEHRHPKYAAMIESMDQAVGQILKSLDDAGVAGQTVVIFTSDNGPVGSYSRARPLRGAKGMFYEGGIREPFLVRYPGVVEAGSRNTTPVAQIDLYPTFLELVGAAVPSHLDGVSLCPAFRGEPLAPRSLFWHFPAYLENDQADPDSVSPFFRTTPCSVIRKGDWKLIQYFEGPALELYNLKDDPSEKDNLASREQARSSQLLAELQAWQQMTRAPIPSKPNPKYRK